MAKATVLNVNLNITKTFKNGKSFDGDEISFTTENGAKKKEFIFANAPYRSEVQKCKSGSVIEVSYTKNGDYFNLAGLKFLEESSALAASSGGASKPSGGGYSGGYQEAPEKQASIQRQNALTNATSMVIAALEQGAYKKGTPSSILVGEIIKIAEQFTAFNAGALIQEKLSADISKVQVEPQDLPFSMSDDELDI